LEIRHNPNWKPKNQKKFPKLTLQSEYADGILSSCFTKITRFNGWDLF